MRSLHVLPHILIALLIVSPATAVEPKGWVAENLDGLIDLYQHFHRNPELSFHERRTAERLAHELREVGARVTTGIGGHGLVGELKNGHGPTLLLRTDMDALPVNEQTGLIYASRVKVKVESGAESGVMHACGHDIHMTNLVGTARYMAANKDRWRGTVLFLCQPAEERGAGAKAMLDDGLFERFGKPDFALALHVDAMLAAGKVGFRGGYALANVDSVDITLHGRGGHGASPHTTIDPIVQAARLVLDLQTIVSREIKPIDPAVVTVGSIHGGTKHNIIGDTCHLQITVRSYTEQVRQHVLDAIKRKARACAESAGAEAPTIKISEGTPAMFNNEELVARVVPVFRGVFDKDDVVASEPSMGGEDFSRYGLAGVPIFMFRLGSVDGQRLAGYQRIGRPPPSLHSAIYYPDAEPTLSTGICATCAAALALLPVEE